MANESFLSISNLGVMRIALTIFCIVFAAPIGMMHIHIQKEKAMSRKTAKWIFYVGTLSSAPLFLILTWETNQQIESLTHADHSLSAQRSY